MRWKMAASSMKDETISMRMARISTSPSQRAKSGLEWMPSTTSADMERLHSDSLMAGILSIM